MDRFTKLLENGSIVVDCNICDQNQRTCHPLYCRHRLIQRLAEYEDTGLEPEEIDMLQSNKMLDDQERRLLFAYESIGPIDHLRELVQAEADKRLVVLPCKVGDTVYIASSTRGVYEAKVRTLFCGHCGYSGDFSPDVRMIRTTSCDIPMEDFNKSVFLTQEEAETALEGGDKK